MLFEVINPSDPVTLEHGDERVAAVATFWLGQGLYGLRREPGETVLPILAFARDPEEAVSSWLYERGIDDLRSFIGEHRGELADCLESALLGKPSDVKAIVAAVGEDAAARARWNEAKRSSLNDICGRAHALAASLRPRPGEAGTCRVCHCTEGFACVGGCGWADDTEQLCTSCAGA